MEAVQEAAQLAGVTLPRSAPAKQDPQRLRKLELNQELMKYANHILHTEDGEAGLRYLQQRGYTKELIDQQQLGHIPERDIAGRSLLRRMCSPLTAAVNGKVVSSIRSSPHMVK